jgi:excisionase family DNA binding protein
MSKPNGTARLTVDIPEAADALGLSKNATYDAVKRGQIPAIRIGRRIVVARATLEKIVSGEMSLSASPIQPAAR